MSGIFNRSNRGPRRYRRRSRGYILLAVLVFLLASSLALTSLARYSLRLSTVALERQRELQQKWGVISCQRTLLPAAPELFADLQETVLDKSQAAPATFEADVALGGTRFQLLLSDENAKLNVNLAFQESGRAGLDQAVKAMATERSYPVRLQAEDEPRAPFALQGDGEELVDALGSWGQVFDFSTPFRSDARLRLPHATRQMTLWGGGVLNVKRAPDSTIVEVCRLIVPQGAARQLQRECRDNPKHPVDLLVKRLNVGRKSEVRLQEILSEQSSCFSLWTRVGSVQVVAQQLAVLRVDEEGVTRISEFVY